MADARAAAASPADEALAAVVDLLLADGYGFTIPAWDGDAYLRISNAVGALTSLTITDRGDVTWEYRSTHGIHIDPAQLTAITLGILDPDCILPRPEPVPHRPSNAVHAAAGQALTALGLTATRHLTDPTPGPFGAYTEIAVTNPASPGRGIVCITADGELCWCTQAARHPDGGLPITDIAAAMTRALHAAQHMPSHA